MNDRNRRNRRHSNRDRDKDRDREKAAPAEPRPERVCPLCPICEKPIKDIYSSLVHKERGEPVHFDCVLQELQKTENLAEGERLCYLGSGIFGVMKPQGPDNPSGIGIRRKFQYEDKEKAAVWRRSLLNPN